MDNEHTINGLFRKRAEIAGKIEHLQDELRSLVIDLDNVDHTLRLFQPDIALEDIKPKALTPRHEAFRGQLTRIVFAALREADGPLTTQDIAMRVMADRGLDPANAMLKRVIVKRVGACLRLNEGLGEAPEGAGTGAV